MMNFDEWWSKYCEIFALNKEYLSFLDVDKLRAAMKLAFYNRLPDNQSLDSDGKKPPQVS